MPNNSAILCDDCRRVLGLRRRNGNIAIKSTIEPSLNGSALFFLCRCGSTKLIEGVLPILLSA